MKERSSVISARLSERDIRELDAVPGETRSDKIRWLLRSQGLADAIIRSLQGELADLRERIDAAGSRAGGGVSGDEIRSLMSKLLAELRKDAAARDEQRLQESSELLRTLSAQSRKDFKAGFDALARGIEAILPE